MRHTTKRKMVKVAFFSALIFLSLWFWGLTRNYDPIEVVAIVGSTILIVVAVSYGVRSISLKRKGE